MEGGKKSEYRYDLLNRQTYVRTLDGREQEDLYDGEGLRAGLKENGKKSVFLFHDGEILSECDGEGMPVRRHIHGAGLSHVQSLKDSAYHAYHQDEQGSTVYITGADNTVENCYRYDAFGNLLEKREDTGNRILYTGQQYDQETGQYYLRARYYNPVVGRFLQEDTYRGDGLNLYAYCANDPVGYFDPSEHEGCKKPEENNQGVTPGSQVVNKTDYYVTPNGDVIPSTGYRYISENAPYLDDMKDTMSIPANVEGTYFSFDNYDIANPGALQVPHDASVKVSFDTLQIIDDIEVPHGDWGRASYLEPITRDFPEFGAGGATQVITHSEISIDAITNLPK